MNESGDAARRVKTRGWGMGFTVQISCAHGYFVHSYAYLKRLDPQSHGVFFFQCLSHEMVGIIADGFNHWKLSQKMYICLKGLHTINAWMIQLTF